MARETTASNYARNNPYDVIRNTTLFLGIGNAAIATLQIVVAYLSASHALFADAMHTYADLVIDVLTYFAGFYGQLPPDANHPYGHRRIETVTAVFLALFLSSLGAGIIIDTLFYHDPSQHVITEYVLVASAISVVYNEILYRYARFQANRIRSDLLAASATHQRSDALSSVLVFATACTSYLPWQGWNVDKVAAVIIGLMILKMSLKITYSGISELIDTGMSKQEREGLLKTMHAVAGVEDIHFLRNRKMAGSIFIDVHVITKPRISVSEGHFIGESLRHAVQAEHDHVVDITVHIDPEDDECKHNSMPDGWPSRSQVLDHLHSVLAKHPAMTWHSDDLVIHYLLDGVEIELAVSLPDANALDICAARLLDDLRQLIPSVRQVTLMHKRSAHI